MGKSMENLSRYGRLLWIRKIRHHTNGVSGYKGKYPKKFEEKYKELQPEKYQDTIQHVIQKGNTPAGMHISIMVQEILDFCRSSRGRSDLMRR